MKKRANIWITGFTSFFTDVSSEMVYPIISLYIKALGGGAVALGFIEGLAESTASLLKVFSGALSDKIGKRKSLAISGYSFSALGKLLFYLAKTWPVVLVGRVVDRFGKGIRTAPRDALIAESVGRSRRGGAFGLHRAMDTAGAVVGIIIAYLIVSRFNLHAGDPSLWIPVFKKLLLASLLPAAIGIAVLFLAVETGTGALARKFRLSFAGLEPRLRWVLGIVFLFTLGNSSNQFILLRASEPDIGFSPAKVILLYLFYNIFYMVVSYPAGRLSDRVGRKPLLVLGYLFYSAAYFLIALEPGLIWVAMGIYGIYAGVSEGVMKALVSELAPAERKATLLGLLATLEGIGLLPASLVAGLLWKGFGASAPFLFGGAAALTSALLFAWKVRR